MKKPDPRSVVIAGLILTNATTLVDRYFKHVETIEAIRSAERLERKLEEKQNVVDRLGAELYE